MLCTHFLCFIPPGSIFKESTFCPHRVFICYVRISCVLYHQVQYSKVYIPSAQNIYMLYTHFLCFIPPGSIFKESTFCPYRVFICYVRISCVLYHQVQYSKSLHSVRTEYLYVMYAFQNSDCIIYSINSLDLITETENVYCGVRTRSLNYRGANKSLARPD